MAAHVAKPHNGASDMNAKPKSNSVITHEVAKNEHGEILITFKVVGAGQTTLNLSLVSQSNRDKAMIHGIIQRVSDAAALSREIVNGVEQKATPANKLAAMEELVQHYASGTEEWSRKRVGGVRVSTDEKLLLDALVRMYPTKTREALQSWLKARTEVERQGLMAEERVKATIDQIRTERAPKGVDASALLGELGE